MSTAHQVENWSVHAQDVAFTEKLESMGATIISFDEQAVSGRELSKRTVLRGVLDQLDRGEADGLAYYDIKRLTRNEWGSDAGIIAKRLVERRAVFATWDKVYRLWLEADLLAFQVQCLISGIDIRSIRATFWRGIFERAKVEAMYMGKPPIGYRIHHEVQRKSNGREYDHKTLEKDPSQAEMMQTVIRLLNECHSLGEACRQLNQAGTLLTARGPHRGERSVPWKPNNLRRMLENPIYAGEYTFGRFSRRRSPVWEGRETQQFEHAVPELAYWTKAQVLRWRDRFKPTGPFVPGSRARKYVRGLIGVLECVECGRPMVSAGANGYQCRAANNEPGLCPRPQQISEEPALRTLRGLLPQLLPTRDELLAETARQASDVGRIQELEGRIAILTETQQRDTEAWLSMAVKPAALTQALQDHELELVAARQTLEQARADTLLDEQAMVEALALIDHADKAFDALAPEVQARIFRELVSGVRIRGEGIARGRRWQVVSFTPKFKRTIISDPTPSSWVTNLASIYTSAAGVFQASGSACKSAGSHSSATASLRMVLGRAG